MNDLPTRATQALSYVDEDINALEMTQRGLYDVVALRHRVVVCDCDAAARFDLFHDAAHERAIRVVVVHNHAHAARCECKCPDAAEPARGTSHDRDLRALAAPKAQRCCCRRHHGARRLVFLVLEGSTFDRVC